MNDSEAIVAVRAGQRAATEFSLHAERKEGWHVCHHVWRAIACDGGDVDVLECRRCGEQKLSACNMDEECR